MVVDQARVALAIVTFVTKPPSISIPDYINLLRAYTSPAPRQRHIDDPEFWQPLAGDESARVRELQARTREEEEEGDEEGEEDEEDEEEEGEEDEEEEEGEGEGEGEEEEAHASTTARKNNESGKNEKEKQKNKCEWEILSVAAGGCFENDGIHALVSALRTLNFASSALEISDCITATCTALLHLIQDLTSGKPPTPPPPPQDPASARTAPGLEAAREAKDIKSVSLATEATFSRLVSSFSRLAKLGENSYTTRATCSLIETLAGLLSCIHSNSRLLVSSTIAHSSPTTAATVAVMGCVERREIKDLRAGICAAIIKALKGLDPEAEHEGNLLEGVMRFLLDASGSVLSSSFSGGAVDVVRDWKWQLEVAAVDETSWYLMRILQEVVPVYNCLSEGEFDRGSREELREVFMNGVFGVSLGEKLEQAAGNKNRKGERGEQGRCAGVAGGSMGALDIVDSPFSREVWNLMGWGVF